MRLKELAGVLLAALLTVACEDWRRTEVRPVQATIVQKYSRRSGKVPRRYYVVVEYEGRQVRIRDRAAYQDAKVGDMYPACLVTYQEATSEETRVDLEVCPQQ